MTELSQSVTVSTSYHLRLSQPTCFTLPSDGSLFPASNIFSSTFSHTVYISHVTAAGFGSGLSKSVDRSISAIACSNIIPSAPVTLFRCEGGADLGHPSSGIPSSPTKPEDLTPDIVPLSVASRDKYPMLDYKTVGGL